MQKFVPDPCKRGLSAGFFVDVVRLPILQNFVSTKLIVAKNLHGQIFQNYRCCQEIHGIVTLVITRGMCKMMRFLANVKNSQNDMYAFFPPRCSSAESRDISLMCSFRKYPLPPQKVFCFAPPHPQEIPLYFYILLLKI